MAAPDSNSRSSPWPIRRRNEVAIACLVSVLLAALSVHWWQERRYRGEMIEIDRAKPWQVAFQVDINEASWEELTLLPEVGEQMARRIVQSRIENGPFVDLYDLRRVRGIGPKTMDRILPYLVPIPDQEDVAGGNSSIEAAGKGNSG